MTQTTRRIRSAVGISSAWFLMWTLTPHTAAAAPAPPDLSDRCVLQVGDLNGDGNVDYAVSARSAGQGSAPIVFLIFGGREPMPAVLTDAYLKRNTSVVLRGPTAVPFTCSQSVVEGATRAGAEAAVTDPAARPIANAGTLIDQPVHYTMIDLNPLTPGGDSVANQISQKGRVIGRFLTEVGFEHAFVYDGQTLRDLGTLGGTFSDASGVSSTGEIVGYALTGEVDASGFVQSAFVSDGQTIQSLGLRWSAASAVNDAGQIVGEMRVAPAVDLNHAFLYQQGVAHDLGTLPPLATTAYSTAHSINTAGQIVGQSNTFVTGVAYPDVRYPTNRGFLYENGTMRDLGSFGARCTQTAGSGNQVVERCSESASATAINNNGQIIGFSSTPAGASAHGFLTTGAALQDLGTLGGTKSWAYGINDSGQIVGGSMNVNDAIYLPFLYDRGVMHNLNELILDPAGPLPFAAYGINNFGQIVGNHHLLNPVYETVQPKVKFTFNATLGETLTFAYWVARGDAAACRATTTRLKLQVRIDPTGPKPGQWVPADVVQGCDDSTDWQSVTIAVPERFQNTAANVHIRVREAGPATAPVVYLRHFSTK